MDIYIKAQLNLDNAKSKTSRLSSKTRSTQQNTTNRHMNIMSGVQKKQMMAKLNIFLPCILHQANPTSVQTNAIYM